METKCHFCGSALAEVNFGRQESCPGCGRDTRICLNCQHYDRAFNNSCRESQADRVVDKEKANFCDYFTPGSGAGGTAKSKDSLKSAADALFKKN